MNRLDNLVNKCVDLAIKIVGITMTEKRRQLLTQFIKFCCVGVINTAVSYMTTVLFLLLGFELLVCNAIAFVISTACAYFLNYFLVFEVKGYWWKGLYKAYCSYALTGIGLNSLLLYVLSDVLGISEYVSPLLVLFVTVPCNFLLNKFWAFRKKKGMN